GTSQTSSANLISWNRIGPKLEIWNYSRVSNFRESNVSSIVSTYCPNCLRDLFFANHRRFAKFAKIRSSRKFSRLQYAKSAKKYARIQIQKYKY
ncbi:MAG: hypothetical protein PV344_08090, partial [Anaplasma sp.]|nr:hypothetical protein [Anaplasma sp.]